MKTVQFPGGPTEDADLYVGPARQVTIDTTRNELRLHDGVTPGGQRLPSLDQLVSLFRSAGEDPLGGGLPEAGTGIVVRTGEATYAIRELGVGTGLEITNEAGIGGNPSVSFADIADQRLMGNISGDVGIPIALTQAQILTFLAMELLSQEDAETGVRTDYDLWSSLRVKQAAYAHIQVRATQVLELAQEYTSSNGPSVSSGSWSDRTLSVEKINGIAGASVAGDAITLPEGLYKVGGFLSLYETDTNNQIKVGCRLYNSTAAAVAIPGSANAFAGNVGFNSLDALFEREARVDGYLNLSETSVLRFQQRCDTTSLEYQGKSGWGTLCAAKLIFERLSDVAI